MVAALAALALGCASTASPRPEDASAQGPAPIFLYEVSDPGGAPGRMFLLGSVHVQDPANARLDLAVDHAFDRADELVVEVNTASIDATEAQRMTLMTGLLPEEETLDQHLSAEARALLHERTQELGLPMMVLQRMRPWLAAITIATLSLQRAGYQEDAGVDHIMIERASQQAKPIRELESFEEQLDLFAALEPRLQEHLLLDALYSSAPGQEQSDAIFEAYRAGDEVRAAEVFFGDLRDHPELAPLYQRLFAARNATMVKRLRPMLDEGRTFFVTIGVGHLVGDDSVIAKLEATGLRARRVAPRGLGD